MAGLYTNKTVAITGGATGIGFALAKQFGAEGAHVVIGEPRDDKLAEARTRLDALGIRATTHPLDVRDAASVKGFIDQGWAVGDGIDVLINNAGIGIPPRTLAKTGFDDIQNLFDVNVFGVIHGCQAVLPRMIDRGTPAAIYNVGSENSFFNAMPRMAPYIATKHAVRGLTEALREEVPDFISIGMICPGFVATDMTAGGLEEHAMDADTFAAKVFAQIQSGAFYIVTHGYNMERIAPVHAEIEAAYATHAPREPGDETYDVRMLVEQMRRQRKPS